MLLIGAGHFVHEGDIAGIFRFTAGQGSTALENMVAQTRERFESTKIPPRVWNLTGSRKRRSLIVMRSGDLVISFTSPDVLIRRMRRL